MVIENIPPQEVEDNRKREGIMEIIAVMEKHGELQASIDAKKAELARIPTGSQPPVPIA